MKPAASASGAGPAQVPYGDDASIAGWAKPAVEALTRQSLLGGTPEGRFAPTAQATRAESLALLDRMLAQLDFSNGQ
ncbi:hypothetical protein D3C81_2244340 [compost metagenome]